MLGVTKHTDLSAVGPEILCFTNLCFHHCVNFKFISIKQQKVLSKANFIVNKKTNEVT
jgi:hypothetical protein